MMRPAPSAADFKRNDRVKAWDEWANSGDKWGSPVLVFGRVVRTAKVMVLVRWEGHGRPGIEKWIHPHKIEHVVGWPDDDPTEPYPVPPIPDPAPLPGPVAAILTAVVDQLECEERRLRTFGVDPDTIPAGESRNVFLTMGVMRAARAALKAAEVA